MKLYRSQFVQWLKSKAPTEIVGENRDCHSCPIGKFYFETSGGWEVVIFDRWGDFIIDRGYSKRSLPGWAQDFVFRVDGDSGGKITAGRALEVLGAAST